MTSPVYRQDLSPRVTSPYSALHDDRDPHVDGGQPIPPGAHPQGTGSQGGSPIPVAMPLGAPGYGSAYQPYPGQQVMPPAGGAYPYNNHIGIPPMGVSAPYPPGTVVIPVPGGGQPTIMQPENTDFCSQPCMRTFCGWFFLYIVLVIAGSLVTLYLPLLGLLTLALVPAITILCFLESSFRKSVIRMQMVITFFEAVAWMIPIVIIENVVQWALIEKTKLPKEGLCGLCVLSSLLQAYVVAGLFEETVKYLAVRRVAFKDFVVDPRALIVYSCCAGAAFGTVEDIMYNFTYGLGTAIVRAFISVPLHCGTGLIIGVSLADRRFFEQDRERWYKTLILPILIHGTFDAVSFLMSNGALGIVSLFIDIMILVGTYLYVRKRLLVLLKAFPQEVDAHAKMINGEIQAPGCGCCNPNACPSCYF